MVPPKYAAKEEFHEPVQELPISSAFSMWYVQLLNHENVITRGPVGVGKTCLANALGHTAVRRGLDVLMLRAQTLLKQLHQNKADNSFGKEFVRLIHPPVLVIDDFGFQRLSPMES
jgi:DNA replication protein DnaC